MEEPHAISFGLQTSTVYEYLISICLKSSRFEEAFELLERSKSRVFLKMIALSPMKPRVAVSREMSLLLDRENELLTTIRKLIRPEPTTIMKLIMSEPNPPDGKADPTPSLQVMRGELAQIYDKLKHFDSEYVSLRQPQASSWHEIRALLE